MQIDIDRIKVDEAMRIRREIGDLGSLEKSIAQVGLINPILIDENDTLVAGFRRLSACRNLGWKRIEVKVVEFEGDELRKLEVEAAENFYRKEFTPEEILSTERRRREIEEARRPKGVFERLWKWLKGLFQPQPQQQQEAPPRPVQAAPEPPANAETAADHNAAAEVPAAPPPEPDPQPEPEPKPAPPARHKTPVITEKDGLRQIKWR